MGVQKMNDDFYKNLVNDLIELLSRLTAQIKQLYSDLADLEERNRVLLYDISKFYDEEQALKLISEQQEQQERDDNEH